MEYKFKNAISIIKHQLLEIKLDYRKGRISQQEYLERKIEYEDAIAILESRGKI